MRLSQTELTNLIKVFKKYLACHSLNAKLYLYGSRAQDHLKGGDIDLLLCVNTDVNQEKLIADKLDILVDIKKKLGDQKVDLLIISECSMAENAFVKMILPSTVLLCSYENNSPNL